MAIRNIVGKKIAGLRKARKLSQLALSRLAGIDRGFLSEIENGKVNVSIVILEKIAIGLETSLADLVTPETSTQPQH
jgi:transcriptional regulator with XRE-family HTH domain